MPYNIAAKMGHLDVVESLVSAGSDLCARDDDDSHTPIQLAEKEREANDEKRRKASEHSNPWN